MIPGTSRALAQSVKVQMEAVIAAIDANNQPEAEAKAIAAADEFAKLISNVSKP